jgi:hypothetical protein
MYEAQRGMGPFGARPEKQRRKPQQTLASLLKSAPADAGQGGNRQESAVYTGVNEHFESLSNAERRRPSVVQQQTC